MTTHNDIDKLKKQGRETGTFYFKHFKVEDGSSTMKVGTDAVLLGAVADVDQIRKILDIGTGCGVIALMLAQRSHARIDAIEIDEASADQAIENARNSPWHDRVNIMHISFQKFISQNPKKYDLVVSNPPFFSRSLKSYNQQRNISRHNDSLSFTELISGSRQLMSVEGSLWVVLPLTESMNFIDIALKHFLYMHFRMKITPAEGKECHRAILQLKKKPAAEPIEKSLVIKVAPNRYSEEYVDLTREFYLDH